MSLNQISWKILAFVNTALKKRGLGRLKGIGEGVNKTGFIFVQYLRGFVGQFCHMEICFLSTPRQMPQTITNIPRCLPQILTVPEF